MMTKSQKQTEQIAPQQTITPEEAVKSIGEHLKQARLRAGLSLAEVANKLKLSEKKLASIEAGSIDISNLTHIRAVLRGYAKVLQTNIDSHLITLTPPAQNPELIGNPAGAEALNTPTINTLTASQLPWPTRKLLWIISVIGIICLVIYLIWAKIDQLRSVTSAPSQLTDPSSGAISNIDTINSLPAPPEKTLDNIALNRLTNTPTITSTSPAATPSTTTSASTISSATTAASDSAKTTEARSEVLVIQFTGTSWYEVRDEKGGLLASGIENAGASKQITATPPINLVLGNATEASVVFKDKAVTVKPSANGVARLTLK
jgi:cytoskeleton protein RodZ